MKKITKDKYYRIYQLKILQNYSYAQIDREMGGVSPTVIKTAIKYCTDECEKLDDPIVIQIAIDSLDWDIYTLIQSRNNILEDLELLRQEVKEIHDSKKRYKLHKMINAKVDVLNNLMRTILTFRDKQFTLQSLKRENANEETSNNRFYNFTIIEEHVDQKGNILEVKECFPKQSQTMNIDN